ncbi:MAG: hypothetical protein QMC50_00530 [Candidatus Poseidoniaceae archaeon]
MVKTLTCHPTAVESRVFALSMSSVGDEVAWSEAEGVVKLAKLSDTKLNLITTIKGPSQVNEIILRGNSLYIIDEMEGLHCFGYDGRLQWTYDTGAGGRTLIRFEQYLAVLDSIGRVHLVSFHGTDYCQNPVQNNCALIIGREQKLLVASEDGIVRCLVEGKEVWTRPSRGDLGESITAMGYTSQGLVMIGREGYAIVAGDEETLEMELWSGDQLIQRHDLRARLTSIASDQDGTWYGFDNGDVGKLSSSNELSTITNLQFPIKSLTTCGDVVVAACWFYLYGVDNDGIKWQIEHQGMPDFVCTDSKNNFLVFAGEDQNDWTSEEPIGLIDLNEEAYEIDKSDIGLWYQEKSLIPQLTADEIYRVDDSVANLLTEKERKQMDDNVEIGFDGLMEDLEHEVKNIDITTAEIESSQLLDEFEDSIQSMAMLDENDLLSELGQTVKEMILPQADAGDDKVISATKDGTVVVLLDGGDSFDPQNRITNWSWIESSGKEISTSRKVKVKLSIGRHSFELRVQSGEGNWTSDVVSVIIE